MGVSLVGLAVLLISFAVHIFHIAQRVKQNRLEREEKVGLCETHLYYWSRTRNLFCFQAKNMRRLRRKNLTTSTCYNNLIKVGGSSDFRLSASQGLTDIFGLHAVRGGFVIGRFTSEWFVALQISYYQNNP